MNAAQRLFIQALDGRQIDERAEQMYLEDTEGTRLPEWPFAGPETHLRYRELATIERQKDAEAQ